MRRLTLVWSLAGMCCATSHAQLPPPLSFFPHHQGDIWEYVHPSIPGPYEQNIITTDSLAPDGRYYLSTTMRGRMLVDTTLLEVRSNIWGGSNYENLTYKLDAALNDMWNVYRHGSFNLQARVVGIFQTILFGRLVSVKQIDYTDSASGLLLDTDYLAESFGLIGQDNDGFPA